MGVRVLFTGTSELHKPGKAPTGALSLELLGAGSSAVTTTTQPARLVFSARYMANGRTPSGALTDFAALEGSIRLASSPPRPRASSSRRS
ncbi:MAG: hypothetical protein K0R38_6709 [Polyangiaceae bacterium]|nr:hypothetical protein [Polyangiaceae bacterium]